MNPHTATGLTTVAIVSVVAGLFHLSKPDDAAVDLGPAGATSVRPLTTDDAGAVRGTLRVTAHTSEAVSDREPQSTYFSATFRPEHGQSASEVPAWFTDRSGKPRSQQIDDIGMAPEKAVAESGRIVWVSDGRCEFVDTAGVKVNDRGQVVVAATTRTTGIEIPGVGSVPVPAFRAQRDAGGLCK